MASKKINELTLKYPLEGTEFIVAADQITGVCFSKRDKMWIANIKVNYKGCCFWTKDFFEAICWRKSMEFKYGYEQAKRMR